MNNNYVVSFIDLEGNEWFSEDLSKAAAYNLFSEIAINKEDDKQVKCNLYFDDVVIEEYDNIEERFIKIKGDEE